MTSKFEDLKIMEQFTSSFYFLEEHPMFKGRFQDSYTTGSNIKKNDAGKAVSVTVWIKCGEFNGTSFEPDESLYCEAKSFEEAIIMLAGKVKERVSTEV